MIGNGEKPIHKKNRLFPLSPQSLPNKGVMSEKNIHFERGYPTPLGATKKEKGVNFTLFSQHATHVTLCLFSPGSSRPFAEFSLEPDLNKTGWIWHVLVLGLPHTHIEYGFRVDGPKDSPIHRFCPKTLLSDPYARGLNTSHEWGHSEGDEETPPFLGKLMIDPTFDWEGVSPPRIPMEKLVIYEMHVRAFTQDSSSKSKHPGSFLGIVEKNPPS